jgi:hypothetical protein
MARYRGVLTWQAPMRRPTAIGSAEEAADPRLPGHREEPLGCVLLALVEHGSVGATAQQGSGGNAAGANEQIL